MLCLGIWLMNLFDMLFFALLLDAIFGEPVWLWTRFPHPATLMGRAVEWLDQRLNHGKNRKLAGVLAITIMVLAALLAGKVISLIPDAGIIEAVIAAILLAQRSLVDHMQRVVDAVRENLPAGRRAVSMIVGRNTEDLDESSISRAAIESGAENFSDGVIAPAFWFLLLGLPGIMAYKIINTADSMIGHKSERYLDFGWAAARLDDVVNYIPARISGAMICLTHWSYDAWRLMLAEARNHRSPNAGWPETASAGVLGIALSGPRSYDGAVREMPWLNEDGRKELTSLDIKDTIALLWRTWLAVITLIAIAAVLISLI